MGELDAMSAIRRHFEAGRVELFTVPDPDYEMPQLVIRRIARFFEETKDTTTAARTMRFQFKPPHKAWFRRPPYQVPHEFSDLFTATERQRRAEAEAAEEAARQKEHEEAEAERRRQDIDAAAKRIIDAIDSGQILDDAINGFGNDLDSSDVCNTVINLMLSRSKASSVARTGLELKDPRTAKTFLSMLRTIANSFKTLEVKVKNAHEQGLQCPFASVRDSHEKGLNDAKLNFIGTWPFGHYRLYVRVTPSSPTVKWALYTAGVAFTSTSNPAPALQAIVDTKLNEQGFESMLVRNSGTLLLAFNALWEASQQTGIRVDGRLQTPEETVQRLEEGQVLNQVVAW